MASILSDLKNTIAAGVILTVVLVLIMLWSYDGAGLAFDKQWWSFLFRWMHVLSGVMWIGLLWYFNFVQIPNMPNIEESMRPAITKVIAPEALFWFRWGAMSTIVTGLILAWLNGYLIGALALGIGASSAKITAIGIGMWLGTIMWANVWFVIWPKQKIALGMVEAEATEKAAAGRMAMLFSRTNTMLSIPMLYAMTSAQNIF